MALLLVVWHAINELSHPTSKCRVKEVDKKSRGRGRRRVEEGEKESGGGGERGRRREEEGEMEGREWIEGEVEWSKERKRE